MMLHIRRYPKRLHPPENIDYILNREKNSMLRDELINELDYHIKSLRKEIGL
jgi:hypothetical protein